MLSQNGEVINEILSYESEVTIMSKTLSTEEFISKYSLLNKPVKIIGEYLNCKTKIKCRCTICNDIFYITPDSLMQGCIHKPCAMKLFGERKTSNTNLFRKKLIKINSNLEVIGKYVTAKTKIDVKCKVCGYIFASTPNNLLSGNGCPNCSNHITRTIEQLYEQINENSKNNVKILSPIISANNKVDVMCNICGNKWKTTPNILIRCGCPNCDKINRSKSHEKFINELTYINPNIKIISKYKQAHQKVKCECLNDGYQWEATPNSLLKGTGCPICREPKGERKCRIFFDKNNITYIQQKTYKGLIGINNGLLRYDFYLPKYNLLIEYQGQFHDGKSNDFVKSFYKIQHEHDKRKKTICVKTQYKIIRNLVLGL